MGKRGPVFFFFFFKPQREWSRILKEKKNGIEKLLNYCLTVPPFESRSSAIGRFFSCYSNLEESKESGNDVINLDSLARALAYGGGLELNLNSGIISVRVEFIFN